MKNWTSWLRENWSVLIVSFLSIGLLSFASFYNLEGMTRGALSNQERNAIESAKSISLIANNPLFLPFKLGQFVLLQLNSKSVYAARSVTAVYGIVLVILFYFMMRRWFSAIIAWLSTAMLATSTLFLHYSRLAVPDILLPLALLSLMACAWWLYETDHLHITLSVFGIVLVLSLYIPGIIWFSVLVLVAQRHHMHKLYKKISPISVMFFLIMIVLLLVPLIRSFIVNPTVFREWLALPDQLLIYDVIKSIIIVPVSLIVRSPLNQAFNLGSLPYLDIITLCLLFLGCYGFLVRLELVRTRTVIVTTLIAWLLIALNNLVSLVILLPLIYIAVTAGIMFLLQQWFSVFPKNPIARASGIVMIWLLISMSVYFNGLRYYVAWPSNPVTKATFQNEYPLNLIQ